MKVLAFPVSSSNKSINKRLGMYAATLFEKSSIDQIDLNDYEVAIFSEDKESESGVPSKIKALANKIDKVDLLVISLAEHNGSYSSAFKNIYDWLSRIPNRKVLGEASSIVSNITWLERRFKCFSGSLRQISKRW